MNAERMVQTRSELRQVVSCLGFTEGPIWRDDRVEFTDIPGNAIHSWSPSSGLRTVDPNAHFAIGLGMDHEGRRLNCEHTTRRVTRTSIDGHVEVLARSQDGHVLNSPNDVTITADGAIYFTDPPFGVRSEDGELHGYQHAMELPYCAVFRVTDDPDAPEPVLTSIYRPNGLVFDRTESRLFVTDSSERFRTIFVCEHADGRFSEPRAFAVLPAGVPDGMAVDNEDRLYVAGLDGVYVYDMASSQDPLLGRIDVPEMVTNCCFGGPHLETLYITATTSLYAIDLATEGVAVPRPREVR